MSSNKLIYDECEYNARLRESLGPLKYIINPIKYEHRHKCRMELGVVGGTAVSHVKGNLVDLETELVIKKEDFQISLLRLDNQNFLTTLRNKLMWGLDKRN